VARALLDLERAALCAGLETLERRALVDVRVAHVQVLLVQELAVLVAFTRALATADSTSL
jgi:hypothetical protein